MAEYLRAAHVAAAETLLGCGLPSAFAATKFWSFQLLPRVRYHNEAARIRRRVAKPILHQCGHLAVHLAFEGDDRELDPRGEVIFQFLTLARIAARRLHLLRAALDIEA